MEKAGAAFEEELAKCDFNAPSCALYSNCTGEEYTDDVQGTIGKQMCSPVRWEKIIRNMIDAGADTFIELGPGNTLAGSITKINSEVRVFGLEGKEDLEKLKISNINLKLSGEKNPPVSITARIDELLLRVLGSNFIPIVDDRGIFIGIVTRSVVIKYFYENSLSLEDVMTDREN